MIAGKLRVNGANAGEAENNGADSEVGAVEFVDKAGVDGAVSGGL